MIGDIFLKPKTKVVTVFFDGKKFTTRDISNHFPQKTTKTKNAL